jgi:hypothetical protein
MERNVKNGTLSIYFVPDYCTPHDRFVYNVRDDGMMKPLCRIIRLQLCRNLSSMGSYFRFVGPGNWTHQQPTTIGPGDIFAGEAWASCPVPPAQTAADRAGSRASEIGTLKILFCN